MSGTPEDRGAGRGSLASWRVSLQLLVALTWVLVATGVMFLRGYPKPVPPRGEPATWKLVVWMILFVALVPGAVFLLEGDVAHWVAGR